MSIMDGTDEGTSAPEPGRYRGGSAGSGTCGGSPEPGQQAGCRRSLSAMTFDPAASSENSDPSPSNMTRPGQSGSIRNSA